MLIEIVGKFYDNHSLSIVNRNIALSLSKVANVQILPIDRPDAQYRLSSAVIESLVALEQVKDVPDIQLRHTYPPILTWPTDKKTKVVYIQPWEYTKAPSEWQYKFEAFADALIVPSNFTKNTFLRGGIDPEKVYVIPNGYDQKVFNKEPIENVSIPELNSNKFTFTYIGNTQWRKGLDILLNAWSTCFAKADAVRLIVKDNPNVYGKTNILSEIIKLQYERECAEIVYIDRDLSDNELAALYKSSKILVHPYRAEGFGMHIQEAMACGAIPIVPENGPTDDFVSNNQGIKIPVDARLINILEDSLFIVKPGDSVTSMGAHTVVNEPRVEALARTMHSIYHSHDRESYLSKYKSDFIINTWDHVARLYLRALTEVNERTFTCRLTR